MNTHRIDKFLESLDWEGKISLKDKLNETNQMPDEFYNAQKDVSTAVGMIAEYVEEAEELYKNAGKVSGLRTGYESIDDLTKGLKGGDLIVIAGQASHGKTLIGNNITYRMAKAGDPMLFVTLEMTKAKVTSRFMAIAAGDKVDVRDLPIYYQRLDWVKANDMKKLIHRAVEDCGVRAVVIDHLHFMADREARDMRMEIGHITKMLKGFAVELNIPIILLAQVKRLQDTKTRPNNNDLKESGYIEQDADTILMIWRDISIDSEDPNIVEVYCTKNRDNGFTSDRVKYFYQNGATLLENMKVADPFET